MLNQPQDFHVRQTALDTNQSFAVTAPAGSGKTGLLTQRLIKLLSHCESPEEVLAITFTRKAAGEMQDRVLKALWHAQENPNFDQTTSINPHDLTTWRLARELLTHNTDKQWNLLASPQRLRIQTIDSLSSRLSQQLPITNGIGGQLQTTEQANTLYRTAVHQLFDELESGTSVAEDLVVLLNHFDVNFQSLENLLIELLKNRDQWLGILVAAQSHQARDYLESVLQNLVDQHLSRLRNNLNLFSSELFSILDWAIQNLLKSDPESELIQLNGLQSLPNASHQHIKEWELIAEFLLTKDGSFRKSLNKNQGFPSKAENKASEEYKNRLQQWIAEIQAYDSDLEQRIADVRNLPYAQYNETQWNTLDALTRILPRLAARLDLVFAAQGEADFIAASQAALKALGDEETPTEFALQLDYQIKHILVDEFQDTSLPQLQLLERLTSGWQTGDGRSLFIVGDAMQSCYGFRNAKVGIFLQARETGIGSIPLTPLDLTVNFRSQAGVVDWVNQVFTEAFPQHNDINRGAVIYSPSEAFKPALEQDAVKLIISAYQKKKSSASKIKSETEHSPAEKFNTETSQSDEKYFAELTEAEAVADLIQTLRKNHPDESVAVLARNKKHLQTIFLALQTRGLSWQSTDIDRLADRTFIMDLTSLLRAYLHWDDRIAWLSILRAPWCGLNLFDLHAIVHATFKQNRNDLAPTDLTPSYHAPIYSNLQRAQDIKNLSDHGRIAVERLMQAMDAAIKMRARKSLRYTLEGIWLALAGPATLNNSDEIQDVQTFFSLIEKFERGSTIIDWKSFESAIDNLYATPQSNADPLLQVMTLHKSKGLEFDHVIIPGLHKPPKNDDNKLLLWQEIIQEGHHPQLLISPVSPVGETKDKLYQYLKNEIKLQQAFESTRLFYVGCTRAIKQLYLFASLAQDEAGNLNSPAKGALLETVWPAINQLGESFKIIFADSKNNQLNNSQSINNQEKNNQPKNSESKIKNPLLRFTKDWQSSSALEALTQDTHLLAPYRGHEFSDDENIPEQENKITKIARITGIVIHSALEQLGRQPLPKNSAEWINARIPFWKTALIEEGLPQDAQGVLLESAIKKICIALSNTLKDPKGIWLLDHTHQDSACEISMMTSEATRNEFKLREHIIDRTFISQGVRWIIDYKSSEPAPDQSLNEFIAQETAAYTNQLNRYQEIFLAQQEQTIKLALYFPMIPFWIEI